MNCNIVSREQLSPELMKVLERFCATVLTVRLYLEQKFNHGAAKAVCLEAGKQSGEDKKIKRIRSTVGEIEYLIAVFKHFHLPAEQKSSNYRADTTHHSAELIAFLRGRSPPLQHVSGKVWLTARSGCSWWMLKQLTLWPMSRRARFAASKVLCQEKILISCFCAVRATPATLYPQSVSNWMKFDIFFFHCVLSRAHCRAWSRGQKMQIGQ